MESDKDALKRRAAEQAAAYIMPGMVVGLGTGSTAAYMIAALIRRVRNEGLAIRAIPTSERSAAQALAGGIVLTDLGADPEIDITIDGADQIARRGLDLIKGMGGALLREKIVAAASRRLVIVADDSKLAERLSLPVPVEVVRFGWQATARHIGALGAVPTLRQDASGAPYLTDGGNLILDCAFGELDDAAASDQALRAIVGVVETGFFIGRADEVLLAGQDGVERLLPLMRRA